MYYLAPECLSKEKSTTGPKVDIWSCGIIFYELLYGCFPYSSGAKTLDQMIEKIEKEKVKYKKKDDFYA